MIEYCSGWCNKMIYCCEEHVSEAMDTILEEYETYPILNKLDVDNLSTTCEYCRKQAVYIVGNK
ncbi:CxxH/CxxC protein [Neobacillus sp. 114]